MSENNKQRLLKVLKIMQTIDEKNKMTVASLVKKLNSKYDIKVDRKAVTGDLEELRDAGYPLRHKDNSKQGWYWENNFSEQELKFLLDSVATARSLSIEDSRLLIGKIHELANQSGRDMRVVTLPLDDEIKNLDDKNNIKMGAILRAIREGKKISFAYYKYAKNDKKILSRNFIVSPYFLVPYNDEYYLIGDLDKFGHPSHFRLDMLDRVKVIEDSIRKPLKDGFTINGKPVELGQYLRENINMWNGEVMEVQLSCNIALRHIIRSKFGNNTVVHYKNNDTFTVRIKVTDGEGFYHWLAGMGNKAKLMWPEECVTRYKNYLNKIISLYE